MTYEKTRTNSNYIEVITNFNDNLNAIRNSPEFGNHDEAIDENFSKI